MAGVAGGDSFCTSSARAKGDCLCGVALPDLACRSAGQSAQKIHNASLEQQLRQEQQHQLIVTPAAATAAFAVRDGNGLTDSPRHEQLASSVAVLTVSQGSWTGEHEARRQQPA